MRFTLIFVLIFIGSIAFGQDIKLPKRLSQSVVVVMDAPSMMADQYEVTLGDWFAFLYSMHLSGFDMESIVAFSPQKDNLPAKLHPALEVFLNQFELDEFSEDYKYGINSLQTFPMPSDDREISDLLNFPVTGISFHQAEEYMLWREELMNSEKQVIKSDLSVRAKLLAPEQWDKYGSYLGPRDIDNTTIYPDSMNTHGCYLMNIRYTEPCESTQFLLDKWGKGLFQTASYFPDVSGLYDLFGNVAEMTSEEGIARGGSYLHWASQGTTGSEQLYNGPQEWLGLRVWFEFYEK